MTSIVSQTTRTNRTGWVLLGFVGVMGTAIVAFGWEEAVVVVTRLSLWEVLILLALASFHYAIRAVRWHMLVRANGVAASFRQNLRHLLGGFAMTATPGRLGELIRLRWLQRETGHNFSRLLPIAFADRAIELASMLLLIIGMLTLSNLGTGSIWGLMAVTTLLVVVSCQPRLQEGLLIWTWKRIGRRTPRLFAKLRRMIRHLEPVMHLSVLVPVLLIGVLGWISEGVAFWFLLNWLDIPLALPTAIAIFLVAILAGALSGLPGGVGGAEATGVALLVLQSIPFESAVIAILIIRITTLWFAVLVGILVFPVAELRSNLAKSENNAVS